MAAASPQIRSSARTPEAGLIARLAVVVTGAVVVMLAVSGTALADGDPASDVLYTQRVFYPVEAPIRKPVAQRLDEVVQSARSSGYPIKVAIISSASDLGTAYSLWGKPQQYARFLGQELVFLYKGSLLIVMPDGFGFFRYKHGAAAERKLLQPLRVKAGPEGLVDSATTAVARLAAAAGHPVPVPPPAQLEVPSGGGSSRILDRLIIGAAAAAFVLLVVVLPAVHRRRSGTQS